MSRSRNTKFDVTLVYDFGDGNEDCRVTGEIAPYSPAVFYLRNGDPGYPAEGGDLEDTTIYRTINGKEVEVEDPDGKILDALQDAIYEAVEETRGDPGD